MKSQDTVDKHYIFITPARLAVHCIEQAAAEMESAVQGSSIRWWFAITAIDQALIAALVETLRGSAGIGAYDEDVQKEWLAYFENRRTDTSIVPPKKERLAEFKELIKRAKNPDNAFAMGGSLSLNSKEEADIAKLHKFRNELLHVKPAHWSLETSGLPQMMRAAAGALRQLFDMAPLRVHLNEDELKRAEESLGMILRSGDRA